MRKNKMMRAASGLLVAVLLTTCIISGTFAKYVTTGTGADEARVAKFGVKIVANGTTFAKGYDAKNQTQTVTQSVISSANDKNVVAPGTNGTLANATITGTPEVAVNVKYEPTLTFEGWKDADQQEYCPIVFKVGTETYGLAGMKDSTGTVVQNQSATISALKEAVQNAIAAYSADYAPNKDLSTISQPGAVAVSWEWAYDKNDDTKDTYLGDQAVVGNASTIKLDITTTVTQID